MKYITETALRHELHAIEPESYVVPRGQKLTPAAREYLQTRKIKIVPEERQGESQPLLGRGGKRAGGARGCADGSGEVR